jgi:hypothetical protein
MANIGLLNITLQVSYLALWDPWSAPFAGFFGSFRVALLDLSFRPDPIAAKANQGITWPSFYPAWPHADNQE